MTNIERFMRQPPHARTLEYSDLREIVLWGGTCTIAYKISNNNELWKWVYSVLKNKPLGKRNGLRAKAHCLKAVQMSMIKANAPVSLSGAVTHFLLNAREKNPSLVHEFMHLNKQWIGHEAFSIISTQTEYTRLKIKYLRQKIQVLEDSLPTLDSSLFDAGALDDEINRLLCKKLPRPPRKPRKRTKKKKTPKKTPKTTKQ